MSMNGVHPFCHMWLVLTSIALTLVARPSLGQQKVVTSGVNTSNTTLPLNAVFLFIFLTTSSVAIGCNLCRPVGFQELLFSISTSHYCNRKYHLQIHILLCPEPNKFSSYTAFFKIVL